MAQHNINGAIGEDIAVQYLAQHGFHILNKNFRYQKAEVDIIAIDSNTLVFIEVKTRSTDAFGHPFDNVNTKKQQLLTLAANAYIEQHLWKGESRFDVVSIILKMPQPAVQHIRNAFFPFA